MEKLKILLKNGWTRRQIADTLGVSYGTIRKWITGQNPIPFYQLMHLSFLPEKPPEKNNNTLA